jgi:hypothetical protein
MANFGVANNANSTQTWSTSGSIYYYVGAPISVGGTITGLFVYAQNRAANVAFNLFDWAIYKGGSDSSPQGATLLWNSKSYNAVTIGGTGFAWWQIFDASSAAATGSFNANDHLWLVLRSQDGIDMKACGVSDAGDFASYPASPSTPGLNSITGAGNVGTSWPATFPTVTAPSTGDWLKARITYTLSAAITQLLSMRNNQAGF